MFQNSTIVLDEILTESELEIAGLLKEEFSEKDIAHIRFTSYNTARTHTRNIRKKLRAKSNIGVVVRYMQYLEEKKSRLLPLIATAFFAVFTSNNIKLKNQFAMGTTTVIEKTFKLNNLISSIESKIIPSGNHSDMEMKAGGYLIHFDCNLKSAITYERAATYLQPEEFTSNDYIEVLNVEVTDMDYNEVELSMYEKAKLTEAVKNNISIE